MLCSKIIFLSNNVNIFEIEDSKYEHLDEIKLIEFVQQVANDKGAERAILKSFHHNAHAGVDTVIWPSSKIWSP